MKGNIILSEEERNNGVSKLGEIKSFGGVKDDNKSEM